MQASAYQPVTVDIELVYDVQESDSLHSIYTSLHEKTSKMVALAMRSELEKWQELDDEWRQKQERRARRARDD